jgi:hypothetical protein
VRALKNRICAICGEVENRDATEYEIQFRVAPVQYIRCNGEDICTRCYNRKRATERGLQHLQDMPLKIEECRQKHGIILRIVRGLPACIKKGGEVVHHGAGCDGCLLLGDENARYRT